MKNKIWIKRLNILIIGLAIVLFWRGAWMVADYILFPNNHLLSGLVSLAIGIIILIGSRKFVKAFI